jgi:hypothetical protein
MDVFSVCRSIRRNRLADERDIMPSYTYKCPACESVKEVVRPMSDDSPVLCEKDAFVMHRDFKTDFGKQLHADIYPYPSTALGVHPDEIKHRMAFDAAKGVPTEYNSEGDPIMRSKSHRRAFCRAHGVHDRNAGYGDPVPD